MSFYLLNQQLLFNDQSGRVIDLKTTTETQLRSNEWKLLQLMIQHSGEDLSVAFILNEIWGGNRSKSSVPTAIKNLRQQLNDNVDSPTYIQTQVMKGYAFIADIKKLSQTEFNAILTQNSSFSLKLLNWIKANPVQLTYNTIQIVSVVFITLNLLSLNKVGAFDRLLSTPTVVDPIPMVMYLQEQLPSKEQIQLCRSLLLNAETMALLDTLPYYREFTTPRQPSLYWLNANEEALVCHLSPLK